MTKTDTNTHTIMIVDDEDEVREMIRRILRFSQFNVIEARDGNEGMEMALSHQPDLITLDIMMPGKDGIKMCEELKANPLTKHIPVIVLTVAGNRKKVMNAGADHYMNKLFSIDEFIKVIHKLLPKKPSKVN
ncbi:response regulator [bacterium]|nr:MAG: response regulator [bacterium]